MSYLNTAIEMCPEVDFRSKKVSPTLIAPSLLLDSDFFSSLTKPQQDTLLITAHHLAVSVASVPEDLSRNLTVDRSPIVSVPFYPLSTVLDDRRISTAMEWLENEGVIESSRFPDGSPAFRFTDEAFSSGFRHAKPVTKTLTDTLTERSEEPIVDNRIQHANLTETMLFESLAELRLDVYATDPEIELQDQTITGLLKALDSVVSLTTGHIWITRDRNTKRLHTPLQNVPFEFRKALEFRRQPISAVTVPHIDLIMIGLLAGQHRPSHSDSAEFIEYVQSGRLQAELADTIGITPEAANSLLCRYVFGNDTGDDLKPVREIIESRFESIAAYLSFQKWGDTADGIDLQNEVHRLKRLLLVDRAANAVFSETIRDSFCGLLNNGLAVSDDLIDAARRAISAAFRQYGATVSLNVESWSD